MKRLVLMLFAVVCLMSFAGNALACACCADEGVYILSNGKPSEYVYGILDTMEFAKSAELYTNEAGFDMVKGLPEVGKEYESDSWTADTDQFNFVNEFTKKTWKFTLKTPGGKVGTLVLPMPAQMVSYKVDIHDTEDTGLGVRLYKEFRFKGYVQSGTGIFRSSIVKPTTYFLVFQGRGNGCDDVSDFTHWHLEIDGKKAQYAFNGKLTSAAAQ
jgi:hypothetical protein